MFTLENRLNNALGIFTKAKTKLTKIVEDSEVATAMNEDDINLLLDKNDKIKKVRMNANASIKKINEIIS